MGRTFWQYVFKKTEAYTEANRAQPGLVPPKGSLSPSLANGERLQGLGAVREAAWKVRFLHPPGTLSPRMPVALDPFPPSVSLLPRQLLAWEATLGGKPPALLYPPFPSLNNEYQLSERLLRATF